MSYGEAPSSLVGELFGGRPASEDGVAIRTAMIDYGELEILLSVFAELSSVRGERKVPIDVIALPLVGAIRYSAA